MQLSRRAILVRLGLFAVAVATAACADSLAQPLPDHTISGARGLRDGDSVTNWGDTATCFSGWILINSFVQCNPQ